MKYKVGDKVRIRKNLISGTWFRDCLVTRDMCEMGGKEAVIRKVNKKSYLLSTKGTDWSWTDEMLEPVPDDSPDDAPLAVVEGPDDSNRSIYTPVTQTPDPKIALHKQITEELTAIYEAKNHDYGDSFQETYRKLGLISAVTRISDKVNRLQSLSMKEQRVADESIIDTLKDCANYCIMTIIAMEVEDNA